MKIAQIGYGPWGQNLFRALSGIKGVEMKLCCDTDGKTRENVRAQYPGMEVTESLDDVLNRSDIESVVIATPAGLHYEHAKKCLDAGKHVFVEKPLALSLSDAKELVETAEKKNLVLMVGHTFLYNDAVRYVKNMIDKGELGEIYYMYFQRLNLGSVRQDVNALWNLAPHDISIAQYWLGENPEKINAQGISRLQKGIEDACFVNISYPSGRFVHIHVSWLSPFKMRQAVIIGSKKMLFYDDTSADQKIIIYDKGIDRKDAAKGMGNFPFQNFGQFTLIKRAGDILIPRISFREPLKVEMEHFAECIREGKKPVTDGRNGLEVVEILETAQQAMQRKMQNGIKY
ncbi:Gfo/Idh/MocA family oxidoreductase, partial [Candidatus Sumerlaeota bacterium]|nr:Gfo/Idh/MocA family oxidoreductase [Candidatus Sumerlaeota bacterium]